MTAVAGDLRFVGRRAATEGGARDKPSKPDTLLALHAADRLDFFGVHAGWREEPAFTRLIARLRKKSWSGNLTCLIAGVHGSGE
jgi:hypothetical protein